MKEEMKLRIKTIKVIDARKSLYGKAKMTLEAEALANGRYGNNRISIMTTILELVQSWNDSLLFAVGKRFNTKQVEIKAQLRELDKIEF